MSNLKNMRVVITGASSGFGSVTAKLLVAQGCKVTLGARREDRLEELVAELGNSSTYEVTDVKKKDDLDKLVQKSIDTFNGVDAIINNAGIMPLSLISAGRTDEWDEMIDVNIKGVLYGTNAVYKHFINQGHGKIINISKERTIDVMITRLRKKIEFNPKNPKYLQTIRGSGYVLWIE